MVSGRAAFSDKGIPLHEQGNSGWQAALDATQGQIDSFVSQLPYKCHQNRVASVGD